MPQIHAHIWLVLIFLNSSKANFVENMIKNTYFRDVFGLYETFANRFYNFELDLPQINVRIWLVLSFWNSSKANFVENMMKNKYFKVIFWLFETFANTYMMKNKYFKDVFWLFLTFAKWILLLLVRSATKFTKLEPTISLLSVFFQKPVNSVCCHEATCDFHWTSAAGK